MGLLFGFFIICCVIGLLSYAGTGVKSNKEVNAIFGFLIPALIFSVISMMLLFGSYENYVNLRATYDGTIGQYKQAIVMYADRAELDVAQASLIDMKYQGYQENMAMFIKDTRKSIVKYNKNMLKKRIMNKNWVFSWLIIDVDDDMKVINLVTNEK